MADRSRIHRLLESRIPVPSWKTSGSHFAKTIRQSRSLRFAKWFGLVLTFLIIVAWVVSTKWLIHWQSRGLVVSINVPGLSTYCGPGLCVWRWPLRENPFSEESFMDRRFLLLIYHTFVLDCVRFSSLFLSVSFPTVAMFLLSRRERITGNCLSCGYNLTGNVSGRCPECGVAIPVTKA